MAINAAPVPVVWSVCEQAIRKEYTRSSVLVRYALTDRRHSRERAARSFRLDGRQNEAKHHSELFDEGTGKCFAVDSVRENVAKHIDAGLGCDDSKLISAKHFAE